MSNPRIPHSDDLTQAQREDDEAPGLGPGDSSDNGSDASHAAQDDTLPLPPRTGGSVEDESADPVGHGETEPDGSPLPPPASQVPWRGLR